MHIVKIQRIQHECTHTHTRTHIHRLTDAHTPAAYQGNETEEKFLKKRKVFKEDLKELTENINACSDPMKSLETVRTNQSTHMHCSHNTSFYTGRGLENMKLNEPETITSTRQFSW